MLETLMAQLWQMTWQSAAVAIGVVLLQLVFGHALTPRWRHALWLLVLGRLLIPVLPQSHLSLFAIFERRDVKPQIVLPVESFSARTTVSITYGPLPNKTIIPIRTVVPAIPFWSSTTITSAIWITGVVALMLRLGITQLIFNCRLKPNPASDRLVLMLQICCRELRVKHCPHLLMTNAIDSPAVIGAFHPRILLPGKIGISDSQIRLVFLHELTHIKCHDVAMDWLWAILQSLHWFNPILWLIGPLRRNDREQARDEMVLEVTGPHQSRSYGQTLLQLSQGSKLPFSCPGLVGILSEKHRLQRRIEMVAAFTHRPRAGTIGVILLLITGSCALTNPATPGHAPPITIAPLAIAPPATSQATTNAAANPAIRRIYDVNDLLFVPPNYDSRSSSQNTEPKLSDDDSRAARLADLKTYIEDNVAPSTWKDHDGGIGSISCGGRALLIYQSAPNQIAVQNTLDALRKAGGLQLSVTTRLFMVTDNDIQAMPAAIKQRLATLSGAGKYRTDQLLNDLEDKQLVAAFYKVNTATLETAPRLTLFNGQHAAIVVTTQQAYVDSISKQIIDEKVSYQPHIATINSMGLNIQYAVCTSPAHDLAFVESTMSFSKLIGLLTEHWPDAPANMDLSVQRPVTVTRERSVTCAIPNKTTLLLAAFSQTIDDKRTKNFSTEASSKTNSTIDSSIESESHKRLFLLIKPTILEPPSTTRPSSH